ncbi:hypothetical protein KFL_004600020 [Klebsormidium nitens]|uniref:Coiled-coil domain-containing protein SCD2 n=1 Tax=Klebsormidium nitens TaxID=105231 RepID=A0A1Y1II88_KLENI|nr:hypothetical protein KFL_004600020 [Klebsormidium nitens]|eukprot:GAQ88791.1 hypothetical protein KFL_004600020 [Klebsormidium nitens]
MDRVQRLNRGAAGAGNYGGGSPAPGTGAPDSPGRPPSAGGFRKTQANAKKQAAMRLAAVMANQAGSPEEEDDEFSLKYGIPPPQASNSPLTAYRSSSPLVGIRSASVGPRLHSARAQPPPQAQPQQSSSSTSSRSRPTPIAVKTGSRESLESAPLSDGGGSGSYSTGSGNYGGGSVTSAPSYGRRRYSNTEPAAAIPIANSVKQTQSTQDKRAEAALADEIDLLREENEFLLDKLRLTEEKALENETRARELEKQVASLGEGISLEARLLSRKEAQLKQKEAALKAASQQHSSLREEEVQALQAELETARQEVASASGTASEAQAEAKALRGVVSRIALTQEELEEVSLKRCWLARYWGLAASHGVHAEIAGSRHEHWFQFAAAPLEFVLAAGQQAKEGLESEPEGAAANGTDENGARSRRTSDAGVSGDEPSKHRRHRSLAVDIGADNSIESMLNVEKGLRELAALKVEDAVLLAMAQHRRPSLVRVGGTEPSQTGNGSKLVESMELSEEEVEDVQFKQAWLCYFWRRARRRGIENDIADERLRYWISQSSHNPDAHSAVDVERGLMEVRRLAIEEQLWAASRAALASHQDDSEEDK